MAKKFTKLTRDNIRALVPGSKITEQGITAERLKNGDVRYNVNIMVDGERVHRVIGTAKDGVTRTQAESFIEKVRTEAREGRLDLPAGRKTHLSFAEAADRYIERLEQTDGKNIPAKKQQLRQHLKPFFKVSLHRLSDFRVEQYKKARIKAGVTQGTVNRELATLKHLLSQAVKWKWIKNRPCTFSMFPESAGRIIALPDEQCDVLIAAAVADQDADIWLFVQFALNTGMRHTEILQTRFEHIDFDQLRLFVPKAKAGQREQPITKELADVLAGEREMRDDEDGWIFPTSRPGACTTGHRHRINDPFRRVAERAGLDPELVTPHVLRHTAITKLVQAGVDLPTIQKISGHKTLAMVLRYSHVHDAHIDRAMNVLGTPLRSPDADTITPKLHRLPKRKPAKG